MPGPGGFGGGGFGCGRGGFGGRGGFCGRGGWGGRGGGFGGRGCGPGMGMGRGFGPMGGPWGPGPRLGIPWLGALAMTAVAAGSVAAYPRAGTDHVIYTDHTGQRVQTEVNRLVVTVHAAQGIKDVQFFGRQDPYAQATLTYQGRVVGRARTEYHSSGGSNPSWEGRRNVITFYFPAHVPLTEFNLVLDLWNDNAIVDDLIGSTGRVSLELQFFGRPNIWKVNTGGTLQTTAELYSRTGRIDTAVPHPSQQAQQPQQSHHAQHAQQYVHGQAVQHSEAESPPIPMAVAMPVGDAQYDQRPQHQGAPPPYLPPAENPNYHSPSHAEGEGGGKKYSAANPF